ncbi:MAG: enoyl-CoA hydratase/isomerase family protein, partial [Spirochaetia bacterium]
AVRVVALSSPTGHFCQGMDLSQASRTKGAANARESISEAVTQYSRILELLERGSFVSLAAVHGHTMAGGVGLAAACSVVLAADTARFSLPETLYGLVPANVFPALRKRVSRGACEYLAVSRACWSAQTAQIRGLVDEVVAEDALHTRSRRIIRDILRNKPDAMSATRAFLGRIDEHGRAKARGEAVDLLTERIMSEDSIEAIRLLAQGQLPPWAMKLPKEFP